jgi:hypothetical protein
MRYTLVDIVFLGVLTLIAGILIGASITHKAHPETDTDTAHTHPHAPEPITITCNLDEIADPAKLPTTLTQEGSILYTLTKLSPSDCHVADTTHRPAHVTLIWAD